MSWLTNRLRDLSRLEVDDLVYLDVVLTLGGCSLNSLDTGRK